MSERKVLNKYFPPDFDPTKLERKERPKRRANEAPGQLQHTVRLMAPFSMRCITCSDWIPKGKKFNARKEKAKGETYLGIQIYRFYIRCPLCSAEITFKTDPENTDYTCEHGAQRNFEPWKESRIAEEEIQQERADAEENNPMKALENRTMDSKREMEILDALDEIRLRNARNERVDANVALERLAMSSVEAQARLQKMQEEDDEALTRAMFKNADGEFVKRISNGGADEEDAKAKRDALRYQPGWLDESASSSSFSQNTNDASSSLKARKTSEQQSNGSVKGKEKDVGELLGIVKRKRTDESADQVQFKKPAPMAKKNDTISNGAGNTTTTTIAATNGNALAALGNMYGDSDSD